MAHAANVIKAWKGAVEPFETGWTLDQQTENLVKYSEDLSQADWLDGNCVIGATVTGPSDIDGDGYTVTEDITVNAQHTIQSSVIVVKENRWYREFIRAKAGTRSHIACSCSIAGFPNNTGAYFDLDNGVTDGTYGTGAALRNQEITDLGDGWYLCSVEMECDANSGGARAFFHMCDGPDRIYNGDGSTVFIAGVGIQRADDPFYYEKTEATAQALHRVRTEGAASQANSIHLWKGAVEPAIVPLTVVRRGGVKFIGDREPEPSADPPKLVTVKHPPLVTKKPKPLTSRPAASDALSREITARVVHRPKKADKGRTERLIRKAGLSMREFLRIIS